MKKLLIALALVSSQAFATFAGFQPANKAVVTASSGLTTTSTVSSSQIDFLAGVTAPIPANPGSSLGYTPVNRAGDTMTGAFRAPTMNGVSSNVMAFQIGVTSAVQTQLNARIKTDWSNAGLVATSLIPSTVSRSLGSPALPWNSLIVGQIRVDSNFFDRAMFIATDNTTPSGVTAMTIDAETGSGVGTQGPNLGIYTNSNSDGDPSGSLYLETGNTEMVGVTSSGDIHLKTGWATGDRGKVYLDDELRLLEAGVTTSTTNYVGLRAAAATTSYTLALPPSAPVAGQALIATGTASSAWSNPGRVAGGHIDGNCAIVDSSPNVISSSGSAPTGGCTITLATVSTTWACTVLATAGTVEHFIESGRSTSSFSYTQNTGITDRTVAFTCLGY